MINRILFAIVLLSAGNSLFAQEMYLAISGKDVTVQSGDTRHQYDIWIKPGEQPVPGTLQIFDAGMGGAVDLISGDNADTKTTFQIYPFNRLYQISGNRIQPRATNDSASTVLTTAQEERFKNRWVSISDLPVSGDGYILRVTTDRGDDVNSFNLRVIDNSGLPSDGTQWKIITFDLSIGVYRSQPGTTFQLRPYFLNQQVTDTDLIVSGEEDSKVRKIDSFGSEYPVRSSQIPDKKYEITNNWGIEVTGSGQWLNTFTIYGDPDIMLWDYTPVVISSSEKPLVTINVAETAICTDKKLELLSSTLGGVELNQARWLIKEQQVASGLAATLSFTDRGQVPVEVLIPNQRYYYPEYWTFSEIVFINTPPVVDLDIPKTILSPSEEILISAASSYDPEGQPVSVSWFVNGSRRNEGNTFRFSNTVSGLYRIGVQVSDGGSSVDCSITEDEILLRVNTQPYAEIDVRPVSGTNDDVVLTVKGATDSDNDSLNFRWEGIGIPANSSGSSITVRQDLPGVYPVRLTVNDGSGATNARYSVNKVYEINAAPIPAFSLPDKVAPGDLFTLNATESSDPNQDPLSFQWMIDDQLIASNDIATYEINEPGAYTVTLIIDDQRGVSNSVKQLTRNLTVNAPPKPVITAVPITSKAKVEFVAMDSTDPETELSSYNWDFGDGNSASGPQVAHTYQRTGQYTVKLTVDDGESLSNSVQQAEHLLVINSYPQAAFEVAEVVAPDATFSADASASSDKDGTITRYEWQLNGEQAGSGPSNSFSLNSPGLHTLSLKVFDDSGFEEAFGFSSTQIRVNEPPVPLWTTAPDELVPGKEIRLLADKSYDPDGTIDEYLWVFEDGTEIKGAEVQRIFQEGGDKQFTLYVTDNDNVSNSTSSVTGSVHVNHQPYIVTRSVVRSNELNVRLDASESYDLDNDPVSFTWTLPDGTKRNEATFTWNAPKTGVHIIGLAIDDGTGLSNSTNSEAVQVNINQPVKAVVDSLILSCTGQTVLFNSSRSYDPDGDPFRVKWEFGDGTVSEEPNPSYSYQKAGQYEATLTLQDGFSGKPSVTQIPVIIEGSPVARLNVSDTTICVNSPLELDASSSTDPSGSMPSINWDLGDGNTATGPRYRHVFTEPGTYTITLTAEGSGSGQCSNISQATTTVTVVEGPEAIFELPEWSAPGEPLLLDGSGSVAQGGFRSAKWLIENDSETIELDGITATHTFDQSGSYVITLLLQTNNDTDCNTVSLSKKIMVNKAPQIVWALPENVVAGNDLELDALQSSDEDGYITNFKWYLDDGFVSYNASELIKITEPGRHKITLEVSDNSDASNNTVVQERYFFANSAPKPVIIGPERVFLNEEVTLRSGPGQDQDGDLLSSTWKINGTPLLSPTFTADEKIIYTITLIQDDGREMINSVDSTIFRIEPVGVPLIEPYYPERIALGTTIRTSELNIGTEWSFVNGNFFESTWTAMETGETSFTLVWSPKGKELSRMSFPVKVEEPLALNAQPVPQIVEWNPVNPSFVLTAPSVNRASGDVSVTWKQNGEQIGTGSSIQTDLIRGQNRFTVEIKDLKVAGSKPLMVDLIVTAQ